METSVQVAALPEPLAILGVLAGLLGAGVVLFLTFRRLALLKQFEEEKQRRKDLGIDDERR